MTKILRYLSTYLEQYGEGEYQTSAHLRGSSFLAMRMLIYARVDNFLHPEHVRNACKSQRGMSVLSFRIVHGIESPDWEGRGDSEGAYT